MKRWMLLVAAAVVLVFLFLMCSPSGGANASELDDSTPVGPQTTTLTMQAKEVPSRSGMHCWEWTPSWYAKNKLGLRLYTFGLDVEWCTGKEYRKVTALVFNQCYDLHQGGADYKGCDKDKGSLGYSSLGMFTAWHYSIWLPVVGDLKHYNPDVRFQLYANGNVTGTVTYW